MSSSLTLAELAKQFKGIDKGFDIKKIVLEDSNVRDIESLEPFTSLEYISFRCNNLDSIEFLINNYYLRHINLSNNKLNLLDVRITQLSKLEYINLANNNLDDISPLNDCTNLKVIVANNNKITKFPRISKLESLEILILSDNLIESVGLPSAHNKKLAKVSLSRNKIREFPLTKFWPSLKELRLNGNKIITLPSKDQLDVMSSIRTLDLGNNSIYDKSYALNLKAFVNLRDLNLLGNPVSDKITIEELELERLIIYNSRKIAKRDAGNNDRKTAKTRKKQYSLQNTK